MAVRAYGWRMSRYAATLALPLICLLLLLGPGTGLDAASGSVPASESDRNARQHRALRPGSSAGGGDGVVEDRSNAIDQPLNPALQLKYYDVVAVDLVQSLPDTGPRPPAGLLVASGAGEGKEGGLRDPDPGTTGGITGMSAMATTAKSEPAVKTLSDQVAEGKYGLIHRELFQRRPQRLGVLNYRRNEEVPLDDERNYGGLRQEEIWLAEDHLLVLKGGSISFGSNRSAAGPIGDGAAWQPIDDYRAPDRQVQIPSNPAVPPPFPVQLREDGPIEFIRGDQVPAFNPFTNESAFLFTNKAFPVIRPEDFGGQNILARPAAHNGTGHHNGGLQYPPPVNPPPISDNRTYSNPFLKLPPPGPALGSPLGRPPTVGSLDDVPGNRTAAGQLPPDEDDPSLYYPPPYTFEYRGNYSNPVPPGPLVPGIILPPPPNFFILKPDTPNASEPVRPVARNGTTVKPTKPSRPATTKLVTHAPTPAAPLGSGASPNIAPSRVEIQKTFIKTYLPVLEVYGGSAKGGAATGTTTTTTTGKRQRVKPTGVPHSTSTHAIQPAVLTPSTKLHKIPPEAEGSIKLPPSPPSASSQPIYAEYFDIKTSTVGPPAVWSEAVTPVVQRPQQPPRTYLPVAGGGKGGRTEPGGGGAAPGRHSPAQGPDFLSTAYGYSPIEQFHREVQTIRQTLQLYEKANKLTKAGRTSKAHPVPAAPLGGHQHQHHHHHHGYQEPLAPSLANLSFAFGGNAVYRTLFPEEVITSPPSVPATYSKGFIGGASLPVTGAGAHAQSYVPSPYEPSPAYVYRQSVNNVQELPQSFYVTTGEGAPFPAVYGRHTYNQAPYAPDITTHQHQQQQHQQQHHYQPQQQQQQQQVYYQPQHQSLPKYARLPPHQPELSYIAPVILNNGASGYNRRPQFDGIATATTSGSSGGSSSTTTTTTKSYLILDHRHVQSPTAHRLRPDRQRQQVDLPYFYRSAALGYENGDAEAGTVEGQPGQRNRYLDGDILVNYKHPLPVLNPDSEFLPYHHRLKVRKRQNVRGAGEHKPRQYFGQSLYNHR